jgi:hypothetical protein
MQPIDVTFFKTLSAYMASAIATKLRKTSGQGLLTEHDFAASTVTNRPETIQLEKPTADEIEHFRLSSAHEAKPGTPKQTPGYNGYIFVENIFPLSSNSAERPRPKSRRNHCASVAVLTGTPHKKSMNRPNIAGLSGVKPIRKTLYAKTRGVAQRSRGHQMLRRIAALFVGKRTVKPGFSARGANIGHTKTDGGYYICDTRAHE